MITSLANIRSACRFQALGDSTNTDFSDADSLLFINQYYGQALALLYGNEKAMLYMEGDIDTEDIVAATNYITPDTDMLLIRRIDIKYPSSADYIQATFIDPRKPEEVGFDKYTASYPEYTFFDGKIYIFVGDEEANIEAVSSGVKIYNLNAITELSGASDEPKIIEHFRDYISVGAAREYCLANEMWAKSDRLKQRLLELENKLRINYARFIKEKGVKVRRENFE